MANDERDAQQTEHTVPGNDGQAPVAPALSAKGRSRRRFARAGAGATGVLLTLHSQPGMACTYCGISPSAALSAYGQNKTVTQMSHRAQNAVCMGLPPDRWCSTSNWPSGCKPTDLFSSHFPCVRGSEYAKVTCRNVLEGASCDSTKMAQYMLAAYLNVLSRRVDFLNIENLRSVWSEWVTKGYYAPMAGQRWYANDIVGYLYGTMD